MEKFAGPPNDAVEIPDFLIKTTLGCSAVVILILIPFTVNNIIQDRYVMALATTSIGFAGAVNIWFGLKGRYSLLTNTYITTPAAAFTIIYTMIKLTTAGSYWPFLLVLAYYFVLPERRAWVFNLVTVLIVIPLAWALLDLPLAVRFSAVAVGASLFAYISMREINMLHAQLKEQAVTDSLTGLFNRTLLEDSLRQAISQNQRSGVPMTLIGFDVDHFKSINDDFGHDKGDEVLKGLSELLKGRLRASDMAFRTGGEEFLVLAYNADEERGALLAEDLRRQVEQSNLLPDCPVTISAGVSALREGMDLAAWWKSCDEKLYLAKEDGRNRVEA